MLYRYIKPRDIILFVKDHPIIRKIKKGTFAYSPTIDEEGDLSVSVPNIDWDGRRGEEPFLLFLDKKYFVPIFNETSSIFLFFLIFSLIFSKLT